MATKVVSIGGASASLYESPLGVAQFSAMSDPPDYLVLDLLSEPIVGRLARQRLDNPELGYGTQLMSVLVGPYIKQLCDRGIKIITNAGGVNPRACAAALRAKAQAAGVNPRIAVVDGSNLDLDSLETLGSSGRDMFTGESLAQSLRSADEVLSFTAYLGAIPIAEALAAGADIVITGRVVDSAPSLGALMHEFGWGHDDFERLAAGSLVGHLLECSTQITGGTFTDWRDVPAWDNIGFPIAECTADGAAVITKPPGTGGLVSVGTVSEQLIYEVNDLAAYLLPDVACDFSHVTIEQVGDNRVRVAGAKGRSRPSTYKACVTFERGWRGIYAIPIVGRDAAAKAERLGEALLKRTKGQLRTRNLGPWLAERFEVVGAESAYGAHANSALTGAREAVARIAVVHEDRSAVEMFMNEAAATQMLVVGSSIPLSQSISAVQHINSVLVPKDVVRATVSVDDEPPREVAIPSDGDFDAAKTPRHQPPLAPSAMRAHSVPLERLAWVRGGEKGDLFNVGVIARQARFMPFLAAALTPDAVAAWYEHMFDGQPEPVDCQYGPGFNALNFVVRGTVGGGIAANLRLDAACKGNAQQLLDFPVEVSADIAAEVGGIALAS
jgi:hypothetical protein